MQKEAQKQAEKLNNEARDIRQRIAEGANSLSEAKLAELQKEFEEKTMAIRRFSDDKQREGQKIQAEGLREIEKQLEPVVKLLVEQEGIDLILNSEPGVVIWARETIDLTRDLVRLLNE